MDLIYVVGNEGIWQELRYSIRSAVKYLDFEKLWIVGYKPEWLVNVNHISFPDPYVAKDANLISKLLRVCYEDISEEFVFNSDDQYLLKPFKGKVCHNGELRGGESAWYKRCLNTKDVLISKGKAYYNYDTHTPVILNKNKYVDIMLSSSFGQGMGLLVNSYYFNMLGVDSEPVSVARYKAPSQEYNFDNDFLNHNDEGLTDSLREHIKSMFPEKSKYERT